MGRDDRHGDVARGSRKPHGGWSNLSTHRKKVDRDKGEKQAPGEREGENGTGNRIKKEEQAEEDVVANAECDKQDAEMKVEDRRVGGSWRGRNSW